MPLRTRGFTLVELMIAVVIVGVLAAIAYPSYQAYQKRAKRSAAASFLLDLANRQQQYLLDKRAYAGDATCTTTGLTTLNVSVPPEVDAVYTICVMQAGGPPPTFTVKATPKSGTMMAGDGVFSLDQNGNKLVDGSVSDKWQGR